MNTFFWYQSDGYPGSSGAPTPTPTPTPGTARDRDVRNAIQTALHATGEYDAVVLWGLPENYGSGVSQMSLAAIEPASGRQEDYWDDTTGSLQVWSTVAITFLFRAEDPQTRDEGAELLFTTAADALNGQSLAGITLPEHTKMLSWRWENATPPERRITAIFSYSYLTESWNDYGTDP